MKRCLGWLAGTLLVSVAQAADVPLDFKRITIEDALACSGRRGMTGPIMNVPRSRPLKEPKAISAHPLYGEFYPSGSAPLTFRLDESRGNGKGYDQLIVDFNGNKDLSDDSVATKTAPADPQRALRENTWFGPWEMPENIAGTTWKASVYAEVNLSSPRLIGNPGPNQYLGFIRLFPGWLIEGTVEIDGVKEKIAFQDGNCNARLADPPTATKIFRGSNPQGAWYLSLSDFVLRHLGESTNSYAVAANTAESFYSTLYFNGQPFQVRVGANLTSAHIEPVKIPLGTISLGHSRGVFALARKLEGDQWEAIHPQFKGKEAIVPAGQYRIISLQLQGKDSKGYVYQTRCDSPPDKVFTVAAGQTEHWNYGLPLDLKVNVQKQDNARSESLMNAALSLFGARSTSPTSSVLFLNLAISGHGGEVYTGFYKTKEGQKVLSNVSPPRFRVLNAEGKELASGSFEFG